MRVRLTMVNENRRYHVALVDPMPAGLEAMNPALAVTGPIPHGSRSEQTARGAYWWWYGTWYEHQNLRDERVEAFASLLWEGVHELRLRRARDDAGQLRRPAAEGRGDVHARDVRARRQRSRDHRVDHPNAMPIRKYSSGAAATRRNCMWLSWYVPGFAAERSAGAERRVDRGRCIASSTRPSRGRRMRSKQTSSSIGIVTVVMAVARGRGSCGRRRASSEGPRQRSRVKYIQPAPMSSLWPDRTYAHEPSPPPTIRSRARRAYRPRTSRSSSAGPGGDRCRHTPRPRSRQAARGCFPGCVHIKGLLIATMNPGDKSEGEHRRALSTRDASANIAIASGFPSEI